MGYPNQWDTSHLAATGMFHSDVMREALRVPGAGGNGTRTSAVQAESAVLSESPMHRRGRTVAYRRAWVEAGLLAASRGVDHQHRGKNSKRVPQTSGLALYLFVRFRFAQCGNAPPGPRRCILIKITILVRYLYEYIGVFLLLVLHCTKSCRS